MRSDLVKAYEEWDEKPGNEERANRLADALIAHFGRPGWLTAARSIAESRRTGLSYGQAIDKKPTGRPEGRLVGD